MVHWRRSSRVVGDGLAPSALEPSTVSHAPQARLPGRGKRCYVIVHGFDEVLARTDPFDLAQALERSVRSMPAERVRALILDAHDRMGQYYRSEFVRLLGESQAIPPNTATDANGDTFVRIVKQTSDAQALRQAFARLLKSNLRAIPLFGPAFAQAILRHVPMDRAVGIGEERPANGSRFVVLGGIALALLIAGAAGERALSNLRVQATATPLPQPQPELAAPIASTPAPQPVHPRVIAIQQRPKNAPAHIVVAAPAPTVAPAAISTPAPTPPPAAAPAFVPQPKREVAKQPSSTPQPAQGVATVNIPAPTPSPQPSDIDVSDMPDAYTDATPLPIESAPPAAVPGKIALKTPTPKRRSRSWVKRTIQHIVPFKPH